MFLSLTTSTPLFELTGGGVGVDCWTGTLNIDDWGVVEFPYAIDGDVAARALKIDGDWTPVRNWGEGAEYIYDWFCFVRQSKEWIMKSCSNIRLSFAEIE